VKNNRLCQILDIQYPIVQAPMNWITGASLAAAVSNAGGLGTVGPNAGANVVTTDVAETGERLRRQIKKARSLTSKPFAVNFPVGMEGVEVAEVGRKYSQRCVEVALEEGIPVAITSVGSPSVYTKTLKDAGIKVLHAVSTVSQAKKAEAAGVDAVICEGYEGGGHKALTELTTMVLVPMTADAVKIPILAGGGIADARGVVAALALGADGVYVGTRFIVTRECDAHPNVKQAVLRAGDACTVSVKKWIMFGRDLKNAFTQKYLEMQEAGASNEELLQFLDKHTMYQALVKGDADQGELPCGQDAGMINDLLSAAEAIDNMVTEIASVFEELKSKLSVP
jgi:NAD(P)H-dependent flavin oxidoreductase YrpB (nitropropane dioxygenase family)